MPVTKKCPPHLVWRASTKRCVKRIKCPTGQSRVGKKCLTVMQVIMSKEVKKAAVLYKRSGSKGNWQTYFKAAAKRAKIEYRKVMKSKVVAKRPVTKKRAVIKKRIAR